MKFWKKSTISPKKELNSKLLHNETYIKINTKEGSICICTLAILIDSVYVYDSICYPQMLLGK